MGIHTYIFGIFWPFLEMWTLTPKKDLWDRNMEERKDALIILSYITLSYPTIIFAIKNYCTIFYYKWYAFYLLYLILYHFVLSYNNFCNKKWLYWSFTNDMHLIFYKKHLTPASWTREQPPQGAIPHFIPGQLSRLLSVPVHFRSANHCLTAFPL